MKPKIAACLLPVLLFLALAAPLAAETLPQVVVVSTGGTIASTPDDDGAVPALTGEDLIAAVPELAQTARVKVIDLCKIDSSQMTPEIWTKLSRTVDQALAAPQTAGAVVTHGTDTMAQAAFFLDTTLKTEKTVVFTGAMRSASDPGAEGPYNILNAVLTAVSPQSRGWGVVVCQGNKTRSRPLKPSGRKRDR